MEDCAVRTFTTYTQFYRLCARTAALRLTCTYHDCLGDTHRALIRRWRLAADLACHRIGLAAGADSDACRLQPALDVGPRRSYW
jgi:hypothetical protein